MTNTEAIQELEWLVGTKVLGVQSTEAIEMAIAALKDKEHEPRKIPFNYHFWINEMYSRIETRQGQNITYLVNSGVDIARPLVGYIEGDTILTAWTERGKALVEDAEHNHDLFLILK